MWNKLCKTIGDPRRRRRVRPWIEGLEGRLVPTTIFVNTFADSLDSNPKVTSLREAIVQANTTLGPDTIQLRAGIYKIRLEGTDDTNAAGDFDVTNPLTITGVAA